MAGSPHWPTDFPADRPAPPMPIGTLTIEGFDGERWAPLDLREQRRRRRRRAAPDVYDAWLRETDEAIAALLLAPEQLSEGDGSRAATGPQVSGDITRFLPGAEEGGVR